jgi:hypothetical protein
MIRKWIGVVVHNKTEFYSYVCVCRWYNNLT